jgi:hypothetical protein
LVSPIVEFLLALSLTGLAKVLWPRSRLLASVLLAATWIFILLHIGAIVHEFLKLFAEHPWYVGGAVVLVVLTAGIYLAEKERSGTPFLDPHQHADEKPTWPDFRLNESVAATRNSIRQMLERKRGALLAVGWGLLGLAIIVGAVLGWGVYESNRAAETARGAAIERDRAQTREAIDRSVSQALGSAFAGLMGDFVQTRVGVARQQLFDRLVTSAAEDAKRSEGEIRRFIDGFAQVLDGTSRNSLFEDARRSLDLARINVIATVNRSLDARAPAVARQVIDEFRRRIENDINLAIQQPIKLAVDRALDETPAEKPDVLARRIVDAARETWMQAAIRVLKSYETQIEQRIRDLMNGETSPLNGVPKDPFTETTRALKERTNSAAEVRLAALKRDAEAEEARKRTAEAEAAGRIAALEAQRRTAEEEAAALRRFQLADGKSVVSTNMGANIGPSRLVAKIEHCALRCTATQNCAKFSFFKERDSQGMHWCTLYPNGAQLYEQPSYISGSLQY